MNRKLLFFDIDGTLVGFDQKMPVSAQEALRRAKENGHKLFLCTGRCRTQIYPWLLSDHPFDGLVMCAGANVYAEGQQIYHRTFGPERMKALVDYLESVGASYFVQNEYGVLMTQRCLRAEALNMADIFGLEEDTDYQRAFEKMLGKMKIDNNIPVSPENYGDMETLVYHGSPLTVDEMRAKFEPLGIKVTECSVKKPKPYEGEVTVLGVTKREGMKAVEEFYGMTREDIIAFGDGPNDLQMLEYAGTGVCLGDGSQAAKDRSDYITDALEEDGLLHAMEHLGLI